MCKNNNNHYCKSQSRKQFLLCDAPSMKGGMLSDLAGVAGFEPAVTESESVALPLGDTPSIIA